MRYFIPQVSSYINNDCLEAMMPLTDWIGFNYFDLRRNSRFDSILKMGIKNNYEIDERKKIFITTTAEDAFLINFYQKSNGIDQFISDMESIGAEAVMGPDWFVYEDMTKSKRNICQMKAHLLNQKCIDLENVIPNIHGSNLKELVDFVEPFREQGKELFVLPGREYLINRGDVKNSRKQFFGFTSYLARNEKLRLIVTGCSSPKLHNYLEDVEGFAGQGWYIQAIFRRIIHGLTYRNIFHSKFDIDDEIDIDATSIPELAHRDLDVERATHNLRKIIENIENPPYIKQKTLSDV